MKKKQTFLNQMTATEMYVQDTHEFLVFDEYSHILNRDEIVIKSLS